ncbi:MAG TPA: pirin family protein [Thermoanaerobaculia bacterium]|nr:pirin family protein [Thermoanaerobaculia bacterium]
MSTLLSNGEPEAGAVNEGAVRETCSWELRAAKVGSLDIRRALPVRDRRLIGPWCFLDRYGPLTFTEGKPMDVAPHPHTGLQTVSWLFEGEVLHRDSLGFEQVIRAGELNLMTSGRAIAHSEESPRGASGSLSGIQLWIALPDADRNGEPTFEHHPRLPVVSASGAATSVFYGAAAGERSPATSFSPALGAEIRLPAGSEAELPLDESFEHGLLLIDGDLESNGGRILGDRFYYLQPGNASIDLRSDRGCVMMLIGGAPFGEKIVMWWNFVGRSFEEIERFRKEWDRGERFGEVKGYRGSRLEAPPLKPRIPPTPAS